MIPVYLTASEAIDVQDIAHFSIWPYLHWYPHPIRESINEHFPIPCKLTERMSHVKVREVRNLVSADKLRR